MAAISYQYYYHAVGQGLFCSGQLHRSDSPNGKPFSWIVDCGTVSERTFLQREMRLFREALKGQPIHLGCLSHFDEDHVNGAAQLLSNHRIDSLVLPFVPLVERLLIAVATPNISKEFLQFLIDPAGYLFGVAGQNLGAVYFVSSASSDGENEGGSGKRRPSDGLDLRPPHKLQIPPDPEDTRGSSDPDSDPPIHLECHDDPFAVSNLWEFMFYNEHKTHYKLEALREAVVKALKMYGKPNKAFRGPELLAELSEIYSASLGDSSAARNRISLITYTGPILQSHQKASHPSSGMELPVDGFAYGTPYLTPLSPISGNKPSALYTGDFPFTSRLRIRKIREHFSLRRWNRIGVLQAPHHGSQHSWFIGAAKYFDHNWSVFSANSTSKHHPSKCVCADLSSRGPVKVNENQRFVSSGQIKV